MAGARQILKTYTSKPTLEGAGVHLRRAFGFQEVPDFDPFLLLDDFRSDIPGHYRSGFPWHPHRGIETITYMLAGSVEHGDSLGNRGTIGAGDIQWMTAGSGIIHQEMPEGDENGRMHGFQLWANLPASEKMMAPRYRDVMGKDIPLVSPQGGVNIRVISGEVEGIRGPVQDIVIDPLYLDVSLAPYTRFIHPTDPGQNVFVYVIDGKAGFTEEKNPELFGNHTLLRFGKGDSLEVFSDENSSRYLMISGNPIREPIAWQGPIVMNTQEELSLAFREYQDGTFLKHPSG